MCFIKHLWEHTIYWDLFAGDKNHLRVLSIQAALILYGTCQQPLRPIPVDSLLVSSPHPNDHGGGGTAESKMSAADLAPKPAPLHHHPGAPRRASIAASGDGLAHTATCPAAKMLSSTPMKGSRPQSVVPRAPVKLRAGPLALKTPKGKGSPSVMGVGSAVGQQQRRRAPPPRLDLEEEGLAGLLNSPGPLMANAPAAVALMFPQTPVKQRIPCMLPKTPRKKKKRSSVNRDDVVRGSSSHSDRRVSRFFVPTADIASSDQCWKETESISCNCKRKRSE